MSGFLLLPPATWGAAEFEDRWFLDLNGDGLLDVAWGAFGGSQIYAALNTGAGFGAPVKTVFLTGKGPFSDFRTGEIMVADVNLDGRQDLLCAAHSRSDPKSPMIALISDGVGGFSRLDMTIPSG